VRSAHTVEGGGNPLTYAMSDPRSSLATATAPPPEQIGDCEIARFYAEGPQERTDRSQTWLTRGQNFVVAYSDVQGQESFARTDQPDEYVVLLPDAGTGASVTAGDETVEVGGFSLVVVPPGPSRLDLHGAGRLIRLFTVASTDLAGATGNAASYATRRPAIPPFEAWPPAPAGDRIRVYSLDVPRQEGRFGRIFRCSTFMVNFLEPSDGPRDPKALSPHVHNDFEQCSLALEGRYVHHLRWPWAGDRTAWREDRHETCDSPSVTVIPAGAIHTSEARAAGRNQLVDIFCPPRFDFSAKEGWVLNVEDYPSVPGTQP
jgi:hypothetical protein